MREGKHCEIPAQAASFASLAAAELFQIGKVRPVEIRDVRKYEPAAGQVGSGIFYVLVSHRSWNSPAVPKYLWYGPKMIKHTPHQRCDEYL